MYRSFTRSLLKPLNLQAAMYALISQLILVCKMQLNVLDDLAEAMKALDGKKIWFLEMELEHTFGAFENFVFYVKGLRRWRDFRQIFLPAGGPSRSWKNRPGHAVRIVSADGKTVGHPIGSYKLLICRMKVLSIPDGEEMTCP